MYKNITTRSFIMLLAPSCQSLLISMQFNETTIATGTAFLVKTTKGTPILITNRHNVTGRDNNTGKPMSEQSAIPNQIKIRLYNQRYSQFFEIVEPIIENDQPLWIEHPIYREKVDVVGLPLKVVPAYYAATLSYNLNDQFNKAEIAIRPSDNLSVVGFPFTKDVEGTAI